VITSSIIGLIIGILTDVVLKWSGWKQGILLLVCCLLISFVHLRRFILLLVNMWWTIRRCFYLVLTRCNRCFQATREIFHRQVEMIRHQHQKHIDIKRKEYFFYIFDFFSWLLDKRNPSITQEIKSIDLNIRKFQIFMVIFFN